MGNQFGNVENLGGKAETVGNQGGDAGNQDGNLSIAIELTWQCNGNDEFKE